MRPAIFSSKLLRPPTSNALQANSFAICHASTPHVLLTQNVHTEPASPAPTPPHSHSRSDINPGKLQLQWQTYTTPRHQFKPSSIPAMSPPSPATPAGEQGNVSTTSDTLTANLKPLVTSFYMRDLPQDLLIGYDTPRGKEIFKDALISGGLEAFFPLSQQFLTQEEPAYCGIGTLCMILNALKIDPAKTWRKPWRWFTQEMLDCCRPLEYVRQNGITLSEFMCLARCNGLSASTKYADKVSLEEFRMDVVACTSGAGQFMAVSYSRAALGQTGSGHFSPVGGYSEKDGGNVLILDVARFKYPSYWVPLKLLYESLQPIDPLTKQPRGYSILRRPTATIPSSLLKLNFTKASWPVFFGGIVEKVAECRSWVDVVAGVLDTIERTCAKTNLFPIANRLAEIQRKAAVAEGGSERESQASFDDSAASEACTEYRAAYSAFVSHVSSKSSVYPLVCSLSPTLLPEQQLLATVLLLSLFSSEAFLKEVRDESVGEVLRRTLEEEFRHGSVKKESELIRRQMESLEECCREECGVDCKQQGRCGKA